MQTRVTSRGDIVIDKWSKLAETSKSECMLFRNTLQLQEAGILHAEPVGEGKYLCV